MCDGKGSYQTANYEYPNSSCICHIAQHSAVTLCVSEEIKLQR